MELRSMELAQMEITQTQNQTHSPPASALARAFTRSSTLAAARLKVFWRSVVCGARIKRKTLSVRETAVLGDRRFVSVIQFERQRFLIGSSPSSVSLLAQLPDESASGAEAGEVTGEPRRKESRKESGEEN